jgi:hypothetical protein
MDRTFNCRIKKNNKGEFRMEAILDFIAENKAVLTVIGLALFDVVAGQIKDEYFNYIGGARRILDAILKRRASGK